MAKVIEKVFTKGLGLAASTTMSTAEQTDATAVPKVV